MAPDAPRAGYIKVRSSYHPTPSIWGSVERTREVPDLGLLKAGYLTSDGPEIVRKSRPGNTGVVRGTRVVRVVLLEQFSQCREPHQAPPLRKNTHMSPKHACTK
jgi:hypothetical protein